MKKKICMEKYNYIIYLHKTRETCFSLGLQAQRSQIILKSTPKQDVPLNSFAPVGPRIELSIKL